MYSPCIAVYRPQTACIHAASRVSGVLEPNPSTCSRSSTYGILNSSAACPNSRPEAQCVYWYATVRSGVYYWTDCMHLESLNQRDRRRADRRRRRHFLQGSTCIDIEQHCGQGCIATQSSNTAADFSVAASGGRGVTTGGGAAAARRAAARRADRRAAGWAHVHPARTKVRSPACPRARRPGSAPAAFRWARARRSLRPRAARDIDRARLLPWQAREDRPAAPWYTRVHRVRLLEMLFSCLGFSSGQ